MYFRNKSMFRNYLKSIEIIYIVLITKAKFCLFEKLYPVLWLLQKQSLYKTLDILFVFENML